MTAKPKCLACGLRLNPFSWDWQVIDGAYYCGSHVDLADEVRALKAKAPDKAVEPSPVATQERLFDGDARVRAS